MIRGETVQVLELVKTGEDEFKADVFTEVPQPVENVIVVPGRTSGSGESMRPNAAEIAYTLHFPKTYEGDLQGKQIEVRGIICKVEGRPDRYAPENTPGLWNMPVEVRTTNG